MGLQNSIANSKVSGSSCSKVTPISASTRATTSRCIDWGVCVRAWSRAFNGWPLPFCCQGPGGISKVPLLRIHHSLYLIVFLYQHWCSHAGNHHFAHAYKHLYQASCWQEMVRETGEFKLVRGANATKLWLSHAFCERFEYLARMVCFHRVAFVSVAVEN